MDIKIGQKIRLRGMQESRTVVDYDVFTYTAEVENLDGGNTINDSISIEADATFVATQLSYMCDTGNSQTESTRIVPLVNVAITDTGSGRKLQDTPTDISALAGTGQLPRILDLPRLFQANSTINVQFSNYTAGTNYNHVKLYFQGYKIWFA